MILEMAREGAPRSAELQQAISRAAREAKCLVLFEGGPSLRSRLEEVFDREAVLVPLDNETSSCVSETLISELKPLSRAQTSLSLILVGDSGCVVEDGDTDTNQTRGFDRWVVGATRVERQLLEAKSRFADRIEALLSELSKVCGHEAGKFQLQAIFYHAAAGLFLDYDWEQKAFRPLLDS